MLFKVLKLLLPFFVAIGYTQTLQISNEAIKRYAEITEIMNNEFPEDEIRSFRRESFTEEQLQDYLMKHFDRMELLPLISDNHAYKLKAYFHSGNWFYQIGLPEESIKANKEALNYYHQVLKALTEEEKELFFINVCFAYSAIAESYSKLFVYDSAAVFHRKNIEFAKTRTTPYYPSAINNYGLFYYWRRKQPDTAMSYFKKALVIAAKDFKDHYIIGSIRDNIADVYLEKGAYRKAASLYKNNFNFYRHFINKDFKTLDIPRVISAGTQHIETELAQNHITAATKTYHVLESILNDTIHKAAGYPNSMVEFLKAKSSLLSKTGAYQAAYANEKNLNRLSDSLHQIDKTIDKRWLDATNKILLDRIRLNYQIEETARENKIKNQRLKLYVSASLSLLVITLLVSLYFRRRQHLINSMNKRLLAEERLNNAAIKNKQLKNEVAAKKRDLSDFAINLSQNQKWAEVLAHKIDSLKNTTGRERKKLMDDLEQEIKNKVSFDTENKEFYERLDKLSDTFYRKLKSNFPDLSKTDKRLCSLIRLKISSSEIARLQNITIASLNTSRYRLRKKFNLDKEVDLDDYIQSL